MKKSLLPLAMLLAALFVFHPASVVGQTIKPDLKAVESGKHFTHHLPRPTDYSDFASLEEWARANYTIYLVPDTLTHEILDGRDTISFFTISDDGIYDHHILSETGDGFKLLTTADLKIPGKAESKQSEALFMSATSTSSGCGQYACLCAAYARCLVPSLPSYDLSYYSAKVKTINSYYPSMGAAAVMNISPPFGHMGVIDNMWWIWHGSVADLYIQLNEANYVPCRITTTRSGKPADMHVAGYHLP